MKEIEDVNVLCVECIKSCKQVRSARIVKCPFRVTADSLTSSRNAPDHSGAKNIDKTSTSKGRG